MQADLISAILAGGALAEDAASRLGLVGESFRVLAVGMRGGDALDNEALLHRCWDSLSLHLSVSHRRAATALIGGVVYAVLPTTADRDASRRAARGAAEGFLARVERQLRDELLVSIGGQAQDVSAVPRSRRDADRVLLVLRGFEGDAAREIGEVDELQMQVLLLRLAQLAEEDPASLEGPLATMVDHDAQHGTHFVETLRAYLDAFGDVAVAARSLGIHHNTLRYRLQKLQQIPGVDLGDPELRLAMQLQLRLSRR
jgi:DNA-binding PucR family transcriptional regulator